MTLSSARADFPALDGRVWFNNGVVSLTPEPVTRHLISLFEEIAAGGAPHVTRPDEEEARRSRSLATIAALLGCDSADLALMRGVSEGYQTVLRGIDWRPGDELVVSDDEEAALQLPAWHLRDSCGVVVKTFPLRADRDEQLRAIDELLTERTRLLAFSHVTTDLGFRLPAPAIAALARARGVLSFVDVAHSLGLLPVDLPGWGVDFGGALSYKWTYAPYASGALYVPPERVEQLRLRYAGNRSELWFDYPAEAYGLRPSAARFQYGPWSWPLVHAWAFSIDYLRELGLEAIWARTAVLAERLKRGLAGIPGVRLLTPEREDASAALVAFSLDGLTQEDLRDRLLAGWGIELRSLLGRSQGVRASVAFFTTEEEVDLLTEAAATLAIQVGKEQS